VLVGGKMGSGGFTIASSLNVFVEPFQAVPVVTELAGGSPFMLEDALGGLPLRVWVLQGWDILRVASLLLCVSPLLISPRDRLQTWGQTGRFLLSSQPHSTSPIPVSPTISYHSMNNT
jgi:hypothetical protein